MCTSLSFLVAGVICFCYITHVNLLVMNRSHTWSMSLMYIDSRAESFGDLFVAVEIMSMFCVGGGVAFFGVFRVFEGFKIAANLNWIICFTTEINSTVGLDARSTRALLAWPNLWCHRRTCLFVLKRCIGRRFSVTVNAFL